MSLLRRALWVAARRAATDPRVQAKTREVLREHVAPRAEEFARRAGPELEKARDRAHRAARDLGRRLPQKPDDD